MIVRQELWPLGVISQVEGVDIGQNNDGHTNCEGGIFPHLVASLKNEIELIRISCHFSYHTIPLASSIFIQMIKDYAYPFCTSRL